MKPPPKVIVGPYTYSVSTDRSELNAASVELEARLAGHSDHSRQKITLDHELGPDAMAETLWHETMHAIFEHTGVEAELDEKEAEKLIRRLSPMIVDVLRRNRKLVAFLLDPVA